MNGLPKVAIPCPDWCGLPAGHEWETVLSDGSLLREHQGPIYGPHMSVGATETFTTGPVTQTVLSVGICDGDLLYKLGAERARELVAQLIEAAAWLEANQET